MSDISADDPEVVRARNKHYAALFPGLPAPAEPTTGSTTMIESDRKDGSDFSSEALAEIAEEGQKAREKLDQAAAARKAELCDLRQAKAVYLASALLKDVRETRAKLRQMQLVAVELLGVHCPSRFADREAGTGISLAIVQLDRTAKALRAITGNKEADEVKP